MWNQSHGGGAGPEENQQPPADDCFGGDYRFSRQGGLTHQRGRTGASPGKRHSTELGARVPTFLRISPHVPVQVTRLILAQRYPALQKKWFKRPDSPWDATTHRIRPGVLFSEIWTPCPQEVMNAHAAGPQSTLRVSGRGWGPDLGQCQDHRKACVACRWRGSASQRPASELGAGLGLCISDMFPRVLLRFRARLWEPLSKAEVLNPDCTSEPPAELVKSRDFGPQSPKAGCYCNGSR